ncbi:MAG: UDP-3-O-(3-hydroxymyristoyl)glucosamine N-acyltransferase [Chlamydiales bacterium]
MKKNKAIKLKELAELTQCVLIGNPDDLIADVADLETATEQHASFLSNPRYLQAMRNSKAAVIFIDQSAPKIEGRNYLVSDHPSKAFQKLIDYLHPARKHPSGFSGIHPTAVIHPTAELGDQVTVGPQAVIDEGAKIGPGTFIGPGSYIGPDVTIGQDCLIHARVVVRENCLIGNRVIIQPGAVIGSCGFGYITEQGRHVKLNQVGYVEIEDDVEIGANTTIDRGRFKSTRISQGTKIDNLVQIGHGAKIGPHNMIVAQTGIAGSVSTGRYVVMAGQCGVAGHIHLDDGVILSAKSGVDKSLPSGRYGGSPVMPMAEHNKVSVYLRNIEKFVKQLKKLEQQIS